MACDWRELDEGDRKATCHAGLYTVPALIAEAEASGASVDAMLRALTIGYEVAARFARGFHFRTPVLHPHASVAATCVLGHAGAEAFAGSTLSDAVIGGVRDRVSMTRFAPEQAWPLDRPARVTLELEDGTRLSGECLSARGGPDRPFSTAEILAKIAKITAPVYPAMAGVAQRLIALDPETTARSWRDLVTEIAGAAVR